MLQKYFRLGHIPEGGVSATFSQGTSGLLPPLLAEIFLFGESHLIILVVDVKLQAL
jgi:hypothetical protein